MPQARFNWISPPTTTFARGMNTWSIAKRGQIYALLNVHQPEMLEWVRRNAPWQDRTGNARALFQVNISRTVLTTQVTFEHGVFYGLYLETHNAGRFAIINRAVHHWFPILMNEIRRLFQ